MMRVGLLVLLVVLVPSAGAARIQLDDAGEDGTGPALTFHFAASAPAVGARGPSEECVDGACRSAGPIVAGEGRADLESFTLVANEMEAKGAIAASAAESLQKHGSADEPHFAAHGALPAVPRLVTAASLPPSLPYLAPELHVRPAPLAAPPAPPEPEAMRAPSAPAGALVVEGEAPRWEAPERAAAIAAIVAALAAYSRITSRNAALTSPVRARIVDILQKEGMVSLPRLAEALQLGRTTIEHHLRVLERCSLIIVSREGRAVLASLPGLGAAAPPPSVRRSPACQALLAILAARPDGVPRDELHRAAAAIPLRTRNHALRALAQRGLVVEAGGRFVARGAAGSQA